MPKQEILKPYLMVLHLSSLRICVKNNPIYLINLLEYLQE